MMLTRFAIFVAMNSTNKSRYSDVSSRLEQND